MSLWTLADTATEYWLDADNAGSITLVGSNVSAWNDLSGNNRHATQGTAANRPLYVTNGLNGKPIIQFDTNDFLQFGSTFSTFGKTYFVVLSRTTGPNLVVLLESGVAYSYLHYGNRWYDGNVFRDVTMANGSWYANISVAGNRWSNGSNFGGSQDNTSLFRQIGSSSNGGSFQIAELAVFSTAISQGLREQVEGYSLWKFGLQASLPASHPYKNAAPTKASPMQIFAAAHNAVRGAL